MGAEISMPPDTDTRLKLGDWISLDEDTVYQAANDGFVVAYGSFTNGSLVCMVDSFTPPTTGRQSDSGIDNDRAGIMAPVKKDDYWEVETAGTVHTIYVYWVPLEIDTIV